MSSKRLTVGVVSTYFTLFDEQMPPGFRATQAAVAQRYADLLAEDFDVVFPGLITSDDDGRRANRELRGRPLDAVVFAPTMAAPPSHAIVALDGIDAPVVIWNAPLVTELGTDLTQAEATVNSTQVAAVMVANALVRVGRAFSTVTAAPADHDAMERLRRTVRGAAAAQSLRGTVALAVGEPIPGYLDVEATDAELEQLGVKAVRVAAAELEEAFTAAVPERGAGWRAEADERSAQLAGALVALVERHGASYGTVNCHGPCFRRNEVVGIPACFAVSLLAERDVPFSCTGDLPTALALRIARTLAGAALYCEFYAPEHSSGLMLLAAGGEGDPALADPEHPIRVEPNAHYPGVNGLGSGVAFALAPGPATVLSLSPAPGTWRLAWATGEIVETRYPRMGGPNAMFRFDSGGAGEAGERWISSGATHHNALAPGRLDVELEALASAIGVTSVRV